MGSFSLLKSVGTKFKFIISAQGWDDPYVTRTFEGLLKWKYAHMNSVDFLFKVTHLRPMEIPYQLLIPANREVISWPIQTPSAEKVER